ncbi:TPA: 23S rRNA (uridine(2552)-2'-O)-methyltransferase [Candidatus Bathyarchaeota archaeon]|nr:23S rRNA (uridine(2552)-2'-O)-methyltransferase [Candidatus Bathyarchaeota archaeon]
MGVGKAYVQLRRKDFYTRLARERGYRSRAAFKLLEANRRFAFIKRGDCVVDLGAYPGGWTQIVQSAVGGKGFVLAVDAREIRGFPEPNVETLVGDITDPRTRDLIRRRLPRKADAIISDLSPKISGIRELDHLRQMDLAKAAMEIAVETLRPGGSFFVKALQGNLLDDFIRSLKSRFATVKLFKPRASKPRSREVYVLARDLRPQHPCHPQG